MTLQKTFADFTQVLVGEQGRASMRATFDLSAKNPNGGEEVTHRSPLAILDEIAALDAESAEVLARIRKLI